MTELGEVSAAGLPGAVGILLLELPADSAAARAGFRRLDVVLDWNGEVVREVGDLESRYRRLDREAIARLRLFRQQQDIPLELRRVD